MRLSHESLLKNEPFRKPAIDRHFLLTGRLYHDLLLQGNPNLLKMRIPIWEIQGKNQLFNPLSAEKLIFRDAHKTSMGGP
jgi:hypothetical protein